MRTALFVSPHLDDVAFSCGGVLARLASEGWRTVLATVFTCSVPDPTGFALACQLDKGLPADVDYMALRRDEDRTFAARSDVHDVVWLGHPEAPHRGYGSAPELFGDARPEDEVWIEVAGGLGKLAARHEPEAVFLPQGLGNHVDHRQVIRAALETVPPEKALWYRDMPYAIREPGTEPPPLVPDGLPETGVEVSRYLETKLDACAAYTTQLGLQFGGEEVMRAALARFAEDEARRLGVVSGAAECVRGRAAGEI